jgi:hypothetical protein
MPPGSVDFFIVRDGAYPNFLSGPSFFAEMIQENKDLLSCGFDIPDGDNFHFILCNRDSAGYMIKGGITVELYEVSDAPAIPVIEFAGIAFLLSWISIVFISKNYRYVS